MPAAPLISPLFLLSGIGMILVAICGVGWWQRGKPPLWPAVWWGVLAWIVSVALKFAATWPTAGLVRRHSSDPLAWLYTGLLTGVFECAIPRLIIGKTRLSRADWNEAVAFGIGFGGIEALLAGLGSLVPVVLLLMSPDRIPAEARNALVRQFSNGGLISIPLPIAERASALFVHVLSSVLLIYAARTRRQLWLWLAFAYKTAIDGIAGWAVLAYNVAESTAKVALLEGIMALFAIIAIAALPSLRAGFARLDQPPSRVLAPGITP